jgi:hypothetical protein
MLLPLRWCVLLLAVGTALVGQEPTPPPKLKPDFVLTAKAMAEEFKNDNAAALVRYRDKVIEVTGVIKNAGIDKSDAPFLSLEGLPGAFGSVHCVTVDKAPWKTAMPGQTVTLVGKVPGFATLARLAECQIGTVKGPQPMTTTAGKLATEYRTSPTATNKKYEGKWLILLGEMSSVSNLDVGEEAKAALMTFKTDGKAPTVVARFLGNDDKMTAGTEAGTKVKVLGSYGPAGKDEVSVSSSLRLEFK